MHDEVILLQLIGDLWSRVSEVVFGVVSAAKYQPWYAFDLWYNISAIDSSTIALAIYHNRQCVLPQTLLRCTEGHDALPQDSCQHHNNQRLLLQDVCYRQQQPYKSSRKARKLSWTSNVPSRNWMLQEYVPSLAGWSYCHWLEADVLLDTDRHGFMKQHLGSSAEWVPGQWSPLGC